MEASLFGSFARGRQREGGQGRNKPGMSKGQGQADGGRRGSRDLGSRSEEQATRRRRPGMAGVSGGAFGPRGGEVEISEVQRSKVTEEEDKRPVTGEYIVCPN